MRVCISLHVYCGFVICLVVGDESRKCSKLFTEVPVIPNCAAWGAAYSFPQKEDLNPIVHINRKALPFNVATFCSCDITIQPAPQLITWRYRSSALGGCRMFLTTMTENNTLECLTDTRRVNGSLWNETLFQTQTVNNDSYVCFGIEIEDPYVEGRSFNVTCSPAESSPIPIDADPIAFNISTKLHLMAPQSGNITDDILSLTYSTAIIFEKKQYETSSLSMKPTDDANHGNTNNTFSRDTEVIKANDTFQNDDQKILNIIIGISSGCVGLILLVSIMLIYRSVNRRKKNIGKPAVRYTITVQRQNNEDLVITDNLVYNLDEDEANVEANVDDKEKHHSNILALVHKSGDGEDELSYANHAEVEYTNSLDIGINTQTDNVKSNRRTMPEEDAFTAEQDVLTDDEKMDLYSNKFISKNKSLIVEADQIYSNEHFENSLECLPSANDIGEDLQYPK